ncbi:MAG: transporter [Planctomycetes bacterium]|nr:transporter [Planctomycetota bacterium]MBI3833793.1 transporter [Planctomycetota bacterium]
MGHKRQATIIIFTSFVACSMSVGQPPNGDLPPTETPKTGENSATDAEAGAKLLDAAREQSPLRLCSWWNSEPLEREMDTDRPDLTDTALAVPKGHVQLEGGYDFRSDRRDGHRFSENLFPQLLLRVGIIHNVEFRLGWDGFSFEQEKFSECISSGDDGPQNPLMMRLPDPLGGRCAGVKRSRVQHHDGGTDLYIGSKIHLIDQGHGRPDFAIIAGITVPTGTADKSSGDVDPIFKFSIAYDLTDRVSVGSNITFASPTEDSHRFFQSGATLDFSYELTPWLITYTEYVGVYPGHRDSGPAHTHAGGFIFVITRDFHLDLRAGYGINREADDYFVGAGFAVRI